MDGMWPRMEIHPEDNTLLWLDCEGMELGALRGGLKFVEMVDVINIEMTANPPSNEWPSPVEVHEELKRLGFYRQWTHTNRIHIGQYDAIYVRSKLFNPRACSDPEEMKRFEELEVL